MRPLLRNPIVYLAAFSAAVAVLLGVAVAAGQSSLTGAGALLEMGWPLMLVFWADADARYRHCTPCFDFGFLVAIFFPVSLLWYCVWSRGWGRGVVMMLALVGLWLLPRVLAVLVWDLFRMVA